MTARTLLQDLPAFDELKTHATALSNASIQQLFDQDDSRAADFILEAAGLQLDFSRHLLNRDALTALHRMAEQAVLRQAIKDLCSGEHVNNTENRPALHTLLRASSADGLADKFSEVSAVRQRMQEIANRINQGDHEGYTGAAITDVVNIGIGGSDLGPRLVTEALKPFHGSIRCHYVANVDPADLQETLGGLRPESTLFIICSKSFRTEETLANSLAARAWMLAGGASAQDLDRHFLAVTTNLQAAADFGISAANCLPMWDWVGGRYSVWSAVGLSCAIAVGWDRFSEFLAGAEAMDQHFQNSLHETNLQLLLGLLELWF
jgi:glucose-6-phosphate isomerase